VCDSNNSLAALATGVILVGFVIHACTYIALSEERINVGLHTVLQIIKKQKRSRLVDFFGYFYVTTKKQQQKITATTFARSVFTRATRWY